MIIVPGEFTFLATPRTASRSIVKAIKELYPEAIETKEHHVHPEDLNLDYPETLKNPLYTVIRNPYQQTLSWFHHIVVRHAPTKEVPSEFLKFIRTKSIGWYFNTTLNPYARVATQMFNYDRGVRDIVNRITGKTYKGVPPCIGLRPRIASEKSMLTDLAKRLIEERFPEDIKLWDTLSYS